ncbi:pyridoxamine 5'-phosphate oxidase family protein [Terrarubrum flagellatum]|uniref:pyridoxamine 5'-phosphate oxidase family protein n=1 Tax=Terrirubrum flagellatum TaxID=2895980 RepID=UPI003144E2C1
MSYGFMDIARTPSVIAAQEANGAAELWSDFHGHREFDRFGPAEAAFIEARDSFFIATVAENGWPYVQHRGGAPGFLRVLDEKTLGFLDYRGNRQYLSLGNLAANDRAALILIDYPARRRMKMFARVEVKNLDDDSDLIEKLSTPGYKAKAERVFLLHLEAFDWNCAQHITPRFSEEELAPALTQVRERIEELEAENRRLRERLAAQAKA